MILFLYYYFIINNKNKNYLTIYYSFMYNTSNYIKKLYYSNIIIKFFLFLLKE